MSSYSVCRPLRPVVIYRSTMVAIAFETEPTVEESTDDRRPASENRRGDDTIKAARVIRDSKIKI